MDHGQSLQVHKLWNHLLDARRFLHQVWAEHFSLLFTKKLFFRSGKAGRELTLVELKDHLVNVFLKKQRQYLVLFPEGGFLR